MGYNTYYQLNLQPLEPDAVQRELQEVCEWMDDEWFLEMIDGCGEPCKWYSHTEDLVKVSKRLPHIKFTLYGEGESPGDLWRLYVFNGKFQKVTAQIVHGDNRIW